MTIPRTPRFWLMTTAALILTFGAQTAQAQTTYHSGTPTMVAAAPSFPTISAEQIARDVTESHNPRTGQKEWIAAPFDAFEDDPTLAGSVRLRSADGAVAIDGQPLRDGALLEIDFYYNSPSDDPFGGRGYGDAGFVNGELAPVVLRDSRILECSTRVENVVYDHSSYYDRGSLVGLYRPRRHYSGHSGFGFGFGNNYYGPGYGYYNRSRSLSRGSHRGFGSRSRGSRSGIHRRILDATTGGSRRPTRTRDRDRHSDERHRGDSVRSAGRTNASPREQSDREIRDRLSRIESYDGRSSRSTRGPRRGTRGAMRGVNPEPRLELAPPATRSTPTPRSTTPRTQTPRAATPRPTSPRATTQPNRETRSQPRRSETRRSEQRRSESRRERSKPPKRTQRAPSSRRSDGSNVRRQLEFFPNDGYGGRNIVTSQSVDCAREDKLRVFIPNERLDAARFDGLTIIALDSQGGETPIYLPPNYIEGYRLAATGQVRAQGLTSRPQTSAAPQYNPQLNRIIESAPCPSGTSKQSDGTCLLSGSSGYPAR